MRAERVRLYKETGEGSEREKQIGGDRVGRKEGKGGREGCIEH